MGVCVRARVVVFVVVVVVVVVVLSREAFVLPEVVLPESRAAERDGC